MKKYLVITIAVLGLVWAFSVRAEIDISTCVKSADGTKMECELSQSAEEVTSEIAELTTKKDILYGKYNGIGSKISKLNLSRFEIKAQIDQIQIKIDAKKVLDTKIKELKISLINKDVKFVSIR